MTSIYDVLRRPILTEKSTHQYSKLNQYVFEVDLNASKKMIEEAVETLFDVEVEKVNTRQTKSQRPESPGHFAAQHVQESHCHAGAG